jgi:hypothetical protein
MKHVIRLLTIVLLLWVQQSSGQQPYEHAAGIRAGYSSGITYKYFFLHSLNAIQADLLYNAHGLNISGMYVIHNEPIRKDRWLLYFGGGPFGGQWDGDFSVGITGIAGMEYVPRKLPLNFGLDWKPMLNVYRNFDYEFLDFGFSIRYRFSL